MKMKSTLDLMTLSVAAVVLEEQFPELNVVRYRTNASVGLV